MVISYFFVGSQEPSDNEVCLTTNTYPDMICDPLDPKLANTTKSTDIKYRLFTSITDREGTYYTEKTIETQSEALGLGTKFITFIIHGWTMNDNRAWYEPLKDALFSNDPLMRIFYIDWSIAGNLTYPISAANTIPIGKHIADFIVTAELVPNKIQIVGHSLGSHVASSIGKAYYQLTNKKIFRITATDPSRPMFEVLGDLCSESKYLLDKSDASFVEVIHTDIGHYGISRPLGHVDYYPNGGKNQPECPSLQMDDNCSHARSNILLIDSLKNNYTLYLTRSAKNWKDYLAENYSSKDKYWFGSDEARGILYFKTSGVNTTTNINF